MAEDLYIPSGEQPDKPLGTIADFGKTLGAGAADIGSNLAANARFAFERGQSEHGVEISRSLQELFGGTADDIRSSMNPETIKLAGAALTSSEFWEHPVLASALKVTGMVPALAALAIPGGILADTVGATMAVAAGGGAINAGAGLDEFYKKLDASSDEDLQTQSPKYKVLREMFDEKDARRKFTQQAQGWAPAINAVIGAAVGAVGPAGTAARKLAGGTGNVIGAGERGALGAGAVGLTEGAVGNSIQNSSASYLNQGAEVNADFQKEIDYRKVLDAGVEGAVLGGLTGGLVGAMLHGKTPGPTTAERLTKKLDAVDEVLNSPASNDALPQNKNGTTGTPSAPVEDTARVGNPQNAPTRSDRNAAKDVLASIDREPVAVVDAQSPGVTELAAIKAAVDQKLSPDVTPEVTAENTTAAPVDTGLNVPESKATLDEQIKQIGTGDRKAVMYPVGTEAPKRAPNGLASVKTERGTFIFDPELTNSKEIKALSKAGRENELLGLGPVTKDEAIARTAAGEEPVAVTERTPDGTEVKAALGTDGTAPDQVRSLEANKTPGNEVAVEPPAQVIAGRTGRVLPDLRQAKSEAIPIKELTPEDIAKNEVTAKQAQEAAAAEAIGKPLDAAPEAAANSKKYGAPARGALDKRIATAEDIVARHLPDPKLEEKASHRPPARKAVIARAQRMIDEATKEGVKVPKKIRKSANGDAASDSPALQILTHAQKLLNAAKKNKEGKTISEATERFLSDEALTRAGHSDEVLATRKEEGDLASRKGLGQGKASEEAARVPEAPAGPDEHGNTYVKGELDVASNKPSGNERITGSDDVATNASNSSKGTVRGVGAAEETRTVRSKSGETEKVTGTTAASVGKVLTPEQRQAHIAAAMASMELAAKRGEARHGKDTVSKARRNTDALEPGLDQVNTRFGGEERATMLTEPARDVLKHLDISHLEGVPKVMAKFLKPLMEKLVGDTPLHYLDPKDFAEMTATMNEGKSGKMMGMYTHDKLDGKAINHRIYISADLVHDPVELAHTVLHEAMHRVVIEHLDAWPQALSKVHDMMRETEARMTPEEFAKFNYAFTDAHEFMSEAFSNPGFQTLLARIKIDPETARFLQLEKKSPANMWDRVVHNVREAVEKFLGRKLPNSSRMIDGVMRVGEHLFNKREAEIARGQDELLAGVHDATHGSPTDYVTRPLMKEATEFVKRFQDEALTSEKGIRALWVRTLDSIASGSDHLWQRENNPVRKVYDGLISMGNTAKRIAQEAGPLVDKLVTLRSKLPEQFREFSSLLHDATKANVHPDVGLDHAKNDHLNGKKVVGNVAWSKGQHPELARRFNALPEELKAAWHETVKFYTDTQNAMSFGIVKNMVEKLTGARDDALAKRIHEQTLTDADKTKLGDNLSTFEGAGELSKIDGPYVPLIRRGDHVVKGKYKVETPNNSKKINDNTFEFATDKAATDYASKSNLEARVRKVWVDEKTGEINQADPETGKPHKMLATDLDAKPVYHVELNNEHVEFAQGKRAADTLHKELSDTGALTMDNVVPRQYEPDGRASVELSASLKNLVSKLQKSDAYKDATDTQKAALVRSIEEAAASSHGSTRVSSKALPRRNVKGNSEDTLQNMVDYNQSASRYLAKLEHMPTVEAGMKEMAKQLKEGADQPGQYARTSVSNEIRKRVEGDNGFQQNGKYSQAINRLMAISFIDKLGSPAYSVINATQPVMITMPYLAGRHGMVRAVKALSTAYADIGAGRTLKEGFKATGRRLKGKDDATTFLEDIQNGKNISTDEKAMFQRIPELGADSGLELNRLTKDTSGVTGKVDIALGYMEGVVREMPKAIEAINRHVTALSEYRLSRREGATHEKAIQNARDAVNNTQFNYDSVNSPKIFNHPIGRMAFQFKKYGLGMYQLIGSQIGKAYRNAEPGDRAQAVKTLITLAGTHMAVAGVLGLPTEPFKYLVMASGLVTGKTWGDVEHEIRKASANVLGATGGNIFSRGLPSLLNLDLSRMGADSFTSFGDPRSQKESDVKSWFLDNLAGPVAALLGDWYKGLGDLTRGDFSKGAEKLIPLKAASDSIRAYRDATEGKKSAGGRETSKPANTQETIQRVLGFNSARKANEGAEQSYYYRNSTRLKEDRGALVNAWAQATSTGKTKAMSDITKWNQSQPEEARILPKDLTSKLKRDEAEKTKSVRGIVPTKRDKYLLDDSGAIYNTR